MATAESVLNYWEQRAAAMPNPAATTDDVWLRELEARTLCGVFARIALPGGASVLDVGCGDGTTTLRLARQFPGLRFFGVDYSAAMVANAQRNAAGVANAEFTAGDLNCLGDALGGRRFDAAVSVRCLINLENEAHQRAAFGAIAKALRPDGCYVAIENFLEGHQRMNAARVQQGLPAIPVRWHNRYFTESAFCEWAAPHFGVEGFEDFSSSYYLATRVLYSAWCKETGAAIDYQHALHRLAVELPSAGSFSPIRLAVLRRRATGGNQ